MDIIRKAALSLVLLGFSTLFSMAQEKSSPLRSGMVEAKIGTGGLTSFVSPGKFSWPLKINTALEGCEADGEAISKTLKDGGIELRKTEKDKKNGMSCTLIERYIPAQDGFRCEIEIQGSGKPWTTAIVTDIMYKAGVNSRIWAPWGDSRISKRTSPGTGTDGSQNTASDMTWTDPLTPRPFFQDTLCYGAPYFQYEKPVLAYIPFQWNILCIPMVTVLETGSDEGFSIILNPDDDILDLTMEVKTDGTILFKRLFNRISDKNILKFSFNVVAHEADWRGGLRWMSKNYPEYFDPASKNADAMAGTGGYSDSDVDFDVAKMKKMAFSINWRASFDFPYMGMFIPPVSGDTEWPRFGGKPTSVEAMQNYADKMKKNGFHVLSYFNVTEFGAKMVYPLQPVSISKESDLWKSDNDFLAVKLNGALLPVPKRVSQDQLGFYSKTKPGGAYFTWEDGLVMDCGEPVYRDFLLDQARKHIGLIPSSDGICIDRLDWLRMYNEDRDDGKSWYIDRPARSLVTSWKDLMKELSPLMHNSNKVIFVNNHDKRLDFLKNTDGIFDEFTYAGVPLNLTAFLCINKPALGWTADNKPIKSEGADNFFQKYLYMGVFPMAPFPGNDHSIRPDDWTDQQYLDYGPLLSMLRGKKWVLEPHCIEVEANKAKANLFRVEGGYVIPVVFGKTPETVMVKVKNVTGLKNVICKASYPGSDKTITLKSEMNSGSLQIFVPLIRGCAVVKVESAR
jgi:hypothetical protein